MYTSFTAKNFRLFENLTVEPLARVNLIGGRNNVGKTTLLEALWLYSAPTNARVALFVNTNRGIRSFPASAVAVWDSLFLCFDVDNAISLQAQVDNDITGYQLKIHLIPETETITPLSTNGEAGTEPIRKLAYEYIDEEGKQAFTAYGTMTSKGINIAEQVTPFDITARPALLLSARSRIDAKELANYYSNIQSRMHEDKILAALKSIEPALKDIRLGFYGDAPIFEGTVDTPGVKRRMPLSLMGDGLSRYLDMLLAIGVAKDGIVLIDEVENGLHHSVMADVWRAIHSLAREFNVQVFATTHNKECVYAAQKAFGDEPGDEFKYHRLDKVDNDITVTTYDDEAFAGAIEFDIEVR